MKILKILILFISITSFAQSKVGTIDVDFVLSKMPELPAAQKDIEDYGKNLDTDLAKKYEAYNVLIESYKTQEAGFSEEQKKQKQEEILSAEQDIKKFQQNGSKLINIKKDDALNPLYNKIGTSLEKISKAEGFTQVFQIDSSIVYLDPSLDLTEKVLKDLGITIKEGE